MSGGRGAEPGQWLRQLLPLVLVAVLLTGCATSQTVLREESSPESVLLLGDSLGASLDSSLHEHFAAAGSDFAYFGCAGTGPLSAHGALWHDALSDGIAEVSPDLVIIQASGNYNIGGSDPYVCVSGEVLVAPSDDFYEEWDEHMASLVSQAQDAGASVVIMTVPVMEQLPGSTRPPAAELNQGYVDLAERSGARVLDWNELLAPDGEFRSTLEVDGDQLPLRAEDGVHFAPESVDLIAGWVVGRVSEQLVP